MKMSCGQRDEFHFRPKALLLTHHNTNRLQINAMSLSQILVRFIICLSDKSDTEIPAKGGYSHIEMINFTNAAVLLGGNFCPTMLYLSLPFGKCDGQSIKSMSGGVF